VAELTIDQALQQAVEAHKAGQVQEADRLYTAILKAQPKHPDANHNMGVLAVGVGKVDQALTFFKTALEANPATAQFWLSYIDALIKLNKLAKAKSVLDQAKSKGAKGDGFDKREQRLLEAGQGPVEANQIASEPQPKRQNILDTLSFPWITLVCFFLGKTDRLIQF
jgi:thioredoxin-like negative regulator of GroEL